MRLLWAAGPAAQESAGQQTMASREGVSPGRRHVDAAASTVPGTAAEKAAPGWPQHRHAQSHDRALKALFTPKTLKPRKKEYLKRRKLKRKGSLAGDGSSKEEELEASLAARDVKPAFGEVAKQPLKASPSYQALQSGPQRHMDSFLAIQLNHPILPRLEVVANIAIPA